MSSSTIAASAVLLGTLAAGVTVFVISVGAPDGSSNTDGHDLRFSEQIVAGSAKDLMIVRDMRLEGTNEQIGEKLAEIAKKRHQVVTQTSDPTYVQTQLGWLKKNWPEAHERAKGVSLFYGKKPQDGNYDPTSLPYDMNPNPGCSVVFYPGSSVTNGHAMLSRNYDFPTGTYSEITGRTKKGGERSMTGDPYVIEMHPDKGYASLFVCSYDLLGGCIDGINEKGVAVALLADDNAEGHFPKNEAGLNEITLTRYVLDRAASAKEARELLKLAPYSYTFVPCHYIICDASGDSFVWEITPDLKTRFIVEGKGKPQIVTNHRLSKFGSEKLPEGNSFDRFRRLQKEIADRKEKLTQDEVRTVNSCVAVPKEASGAATLWHSVYDLKERKVKISFFLGKDSLGNERRTPYIEFGFTK